MVERTRLWGFRHVATRYMNPLTRPFAGWLPGFGILTHEGRSTGRVYRTPINVFRRDGGYVFLLTYGSDVQWVKNVLAAGRCSLRTRGRDMVLVDPELIDDPERSIVPLVVRSVGGVIRARRFLRMRAA